MRDFDRHEQQVNKAVSWAARISAVVSLVMLGFWGLVGYLLYRVVTELVLGD